MSRYLNELKRGAPWILAGALAGGVSFIVAQLAAGFPVTIAQFMGRQIVASGGYDESLAGLIGHVVHFGVALSYSVLFAIVVLLVPIPAERRIRWSVTAGIAIAFAWMSTLLTGPAIPITIGLLSGTGLPNDPGAEHWVRVPVLESWDSSP